MAAAEGQRQQLGAAAAVAEQQQAAPEQACGGDGATTGAAAGVGLCMQMHMQMLPARSVGIGSQLVLVASQS